MSLSGDTPDDASYTAKTGFSAGLIGEYALTADIHLSLQPSYISRGTGIAYDVGEADPRDSLSLRLDYLSVLSWRDFSPPEDFGLSTEDSIYRSFSMHPSGCQRGWHEGCHDALNSVDLMMLVGVGGIVNATPCASPWKSAFPRG